MYSLSPVDLIQLGQQLVVFRDALFVFLTKTNHPLLIDDEDRPLGIALGSQAVISAAHCAVGIEIREHGKVNPSHLFGKRFMGKRRINAYAQHLSVPRFEFLALGLEAGQFPLSTAGKIQRIKGEDDILLPQKVPESDLFFS